MTGFTDSNKSLTEFWPKMSELKHVGKVKNISHRDRIGQIADHDWHKIQKRWRDQDVKVKRFPWHMGHVDFRDRLIEQKGNQDAGDPEEKQQWGLTVHSQPWWSGSCWSPSPWCSGTPAWTHSAFPGSSPPPRLWSWTGPSAPSVECSWLLILPWGLLSEQGRGFKKGSVFRKIQTKSKQDLHILSIVSKTLRKGNKMFLESKHPSSWLK